MRRFAALRTTLIVAAITIALCEAVSFFALKFLQPPSSLSIFEDVLVSGGRVMPVKAKLDQRWRTAEFDVAMRTNSNGYREDFDFQLADVEYAFMGDSFTFGHGVEVQERYTNLFAGRLGGKVDPRHVVSLSGNNGFQPEHYEYFLKKHPELKPKYVIIGLYLGNDLEPDVRETRFDRQSLTFELPYRAVDSGVIVNAAPYRVPFLRELIRVSRTARLTAILLNRSIYRSYLFEANAAIPNGYNSDSLEFGGSNEFSNRAFESLVSIRDLVRQRGGRLLVFLIPQNFYAGPVTRPHLSPPLWPRIPEILAQGGLRAAAIHRCKEMALDCLDAGRVMTVEDFFPADAHWNRKGHRKAADLLFGYFSANAELR
ncbi:MAG: hydrolase family protein [Bradyrhizobium sp.]|nr:hydrolase family protein [Bradyrhizobium sp.]